jgi:ribonuclease VapC
VTFVLDASAVLAAMQGESGGDRLATAGPDLEISSVNVSEIFSTLIDAGVPMPEVRADFGRLELIVRDFREAHAIIVGELRPATRDFGLSLGDRACLAQATISNLPILTGDRRQAEKAQLLGLTVELIRE